METIQIIEGSLLNFFEVLILSGIKFAFGPALSMGLGFSYFQTIIVTSIGGLAGVYFFYYVSEWILKLYNNHISLYFKNTKKLRPEYLKLTKNTNPPKVKKSFTFLNKTIVKTRSSFGIKGIAILTPVLLSIPLGTFLVNKYYGQNNKKLIYLSISVMIWSFIFSSLLFIFRFNETLPIN